MGRNFCRTAYICLGANLGDCKKNLATALGEINALPGCDVNSVSQIYFTEPQNIAFQPWFHNQVARLRLSGWQPEAFLEALLKIESRLGRRREKTVRFGPRMIDIDLLLFGDEVSENPFCRLPHPRMFERAFVLAPLLEIAPDLIVNNIPVAEKLACLDWKKDGRLIWQKEKE